MMASISHHPVVTSDTGNILDDAHPSFPTSDTPSASHPSDLPTSPVNTSQTQNDLASIVRNSSASLDTVRPRGNSTTSQSSVKRKPLPSSASPLATGYSRASRDSLAAAINTKIDPPFTRSLTGDSPTLYDNPFKPYEYQNEPQPPLPEDFRERQREFSNSNESSASTSPSLSFSLYQDEEEPQSLSLEVPGRDKAAVDNTLASHQDAGLGSDTALSVTSNSTEPWVEDNSSPISRSATMSLFSSKPPPPKLTLPPVEAPLPADDTISPNTNKALPKSPVVKSPGTSKLGSFFGWGGGGTTSPSSSTTSFSEDRAYSPIPSPSLQSSLPTANSVGSGRTVPAGIDIPKANANEAGYFSDYLQIPPATPESTVHVDEMEAELKAISSELALSIKREFELEDLVERMQSESSNPGKRTSDYFSDSGISSVKYGGDTERAEELDRLQRRTEREKAQIRMELTDKVNDERSRRKVLESQIRHLEEKASQVDLHSMNSLDANGRLKELETQCEDLRRRLTEEKQVKENFEDLLTALKDELQNSHNERDNLKDEIVPQLRARVEGLEAQAATHEKLTYENTKMQQELQMLKNENTTLINARKTQMDMQSQMTRFNSIAEDGLPQNGLSRSNTTSGTRNGSRPSSLSRSTSVKVAESREVLAERVKDAEAQRDALHRALKSLLERQEHQNRAHDARIKQLELELNRTPDSSPKRAGYEREVRNLREEINTLRRRADDAMNQKIQCEKGLVGLKMDLQRAEQEISSLRSMLAETPSPSKSRGQLGRSNSVTSDSLERAYTDLKSAHAAALDRVKALELQNNAESTSRLNELKGSLEQANSERDIALKEAKTLREVNGSLHSSEKSHLESEQALAEELRVSAERVEDLAAQVRQQLASNATLRKRLAETIDRGEKEQKNNAERLVSMQAKLKTLEDKLIAAQQNSEDRMADHEEEVKSLKDAHNNQLSRVRNSLKSPRVFSPGTPISPLFTSMAKQPRLSRTISGPGMSISEESKVDFLKKRVEELEKALLDADREMEEVVSRMNSAQIEVMELWNEREEAVRVTRRLEKEIEEERKRTFEGKFKTLQS